ncbi:hypothetical protein RRG08_064004 [Elysia crispata]|uniref:Uncharacterized protein n=1 Tax=Elysia crispata TaxID=231223 RepID=A0AAE0YFG5_9GAST|nr:hypothetical protein RRG08_064004 [Elysia crispata]
MPSQGQDRVRTNDLGRLEISTVHRRPWHSRRQTCAARRKCIQQTTHRLRVRCAGKYCSQSDEQEVSQLVKHYRSESERPCIQDNQGGEGRGAIWDSHNVIMKRVGEAVHPGQPGRPQPVIRLPLTRVTSATTTGVWTTSTHRYSVYSAQVHPASTTLRMQ